MLNSQILTVVGEIQQGIEFIQKIHRTYLQFQRFFAAVDTRDMRDAVMLTEILCSTYTCIETVLFRIARLFENHLDPEKCHKELLHKMTLDIPKVRKAVLSHESYMLLDELRRFRHFKRYYYDFEYDWGKLDYLRSIYEKLLPLIEEELNEYTDFLLQISEE